MCIYIWRYVYMNDFIVYQCEKLNLYVDKWETAELVYSYFFLTYDPMGLRGFPLCKYNHLDGVGTN